MPLKIVVVLRLAGEDRVLSDGSTRLVMDLSSLEFIDSSGLRVLAILLKRVLATEGGSLHLLRPSPSVRRVFAITYLDAAIPVVDSLADLPPVPAV